MIPIFIFLLLMPMGGVLGGTQGMVIGAQSTETPLNTASVPDHPAMATALDWAAPMENKTTPGGTTTAASEGPVHFWSASTHTGGVDIYVVVFLIIFVIIGFWTCYNRITPMLRISPVRSRRATKRAKGVLKHGKRSSMSDGDNVPFLSGDQDRAQKML